MSRLISSLLLASGVVAATLAANPAQATPAPTAAPNCTRTWVGDQDNLWSDKRAWLPIGTPTATDDVCVPADYSITDDHTPYTVHNLYVGFQGHLVVEDRLRITGRLLVDGIAQAFAPLAVSGPINVDHGLVVIAESVTAAAVNLLDPNAQFYAGAESVVRVGPVTIKGGSFGLGGDSVLASWVQQSGRAILEGGVTQVGTDARPGTVVLSGGTNLLLWFYPRLIASVRQQDATLEIRPAVRGCPTANIVGDLTQTAASVTDYETPQCKPVGRSTMLRVSGTATVAGEVIPPGGDSRTFPDGARMTAVLADGGRSGQWAPPASHWRPRYTATAADLVYRV